MSVYTGIPRQRGTAPVRPGRPGGWSLGDALDGIGLFDGLDKRLRRQLITGAQPRHYQRGDLLYAEREAGKDLLLLLSGTVVLFRGTPTRRRATLAVVRPPAVLGEEAIAGGVPRTASAEAIRASFVLALPEAELAGVMHQQPTMGEAARRWLVSRLGDLAEQRADDLLLDLPTRVAKALLRLATGGGNPPLVVDYSQELVATLARGSRQSVNQALKRYADRGWLRIERGRLVITDVDALARRAGLPG